MSSIARAELTWVGLDVHKDSIHAGILRPGSESVELGALVNDEYSVRKFFARGLGPKGQLRVCYEAGPTGYVLARQLQTIGVACQVIAPSLIPQAPGDKVKTDRRDARRLTRLYRAGELVAIRVPAPGEEAVRDLCRARTDMVEDLTRARNRLTKFLLRHGRIWRGGSNWSIAHHRWLESQHFDERALELTYSHYRATLHARQSALEAASADVAVFFERAPFADPVARLSAYRGVVGWGRSPSPARCATFGAFPEPSTSPGSPAWCPPNTPAAPPSLEVGSLGPATPICAPS
jgi:transposase